MILLASRFLMLSERPRRFLSDSDGPPFVPPALWLCPMRGGVPFHGIPESGILESLTSEPRYAKYIDWVHSPPNFPAISLNGADQRSSPPIPTALGNRVVLSGAQEVNAFCSMRMYVDDADKSNAIVKISPHVSGNSLCPLLTPPRACPLIPSLPPSALLSNLRQRRRQSSTRSSQVTMRLHRLAFGLLGPHLPLAVSSGLSRKSTSRPYAHTACRGRSRDGLGRRLL
jgi:hypothetical protein